MPLDSSPSGGQHNDGQASLVIYSSVSFSSAGLSTLRSPSCEATRVAVGLQRQELFSFSSSGLYRPVKLWKHSVQGCSSKIAVASRLLFQVARVFRTLLSIFQTRFSLMRVFAQPSTFHRSFQCFSLLIFYSAQRSISGNTLEETGLGRFLMMHSPTQSKQLVSFEGRSILSALRSDFHSLTSH